MQKVFEKLRLLQVILSKKYEVQNEIREIPKTLGTKIELLNRGKKNYLEKNEKLSSIKDELKSLKIRLDDAERERENYEKQMDLITTQREYEALDKEIKDASEREQLLRKTILHKETVLDELVSQIEEHEELMNLQEEEVGIEKEKMESILKQKEDELTTLKEQENELIPGIDENVLFKFERIIKSKSGVGIVPIHDIVCTGCHMSLPAQFVNDVRGGKDFMFCPYCSRILFYEEIEEDVISPAVGADDIEEGALADLVDLDEFDL
ncbi:MAG: C4-type zinc ribbon domain-containing protein [Bacteroidales bacterium]|jgi:predicted  nucleic acid-binding Zn-ribbon protein|nr:C4-type zinc ribbon domain-containing protein [Bacteroidales bacterium]